MSHDELSRLRADLEALRQEVRELRATLDGAGPPGELVCSSLRVVTPSGRTIVQAGSYRDGGFVEVAGPAEEDTRLGLSSTPGNPMMWIAAPGTKKLVTLGVSGGLASAWRGSLTIGHASYPGAVVLRADDSGGVLEAFNRHGKVAAAMFGNASCESPPPFDGHGEISVSDGAGNPRVSISGYPAEPQVLVQSVPSVPFAVLTPHGVSTHPGPPAAGDVRQEPTVA